jgi:hypothetical protein
VGWRTRTHEDEPGHAAPGRPGAWQRFNAHTPRYRISAVVWGLSIFLIPVSFLLHSPVATAAAIFLTWIAIHAFRRADMSERRAQAEDGGDGPADPATSAGTTPR